MNLTSMILIAGLAAGSLSLSAAAQSAPGDVPGTNGSGTTATDCTKAKHPAHCEARQKARAACTDKKGAEHRQCVRDNMPPRDCGKSKNPQRFEIRQKAQETCKGKTGRERKHCVREQIKAATPEAKN